MNRRDIERRIWRSVADTRRTVTRSGSAKSALASLGDPDRHDVAGWTAATSQRHEHYRQTHPVAAGSAAVVCVSMRPDFVDAVVDNILRQDHDGLDVVFVANSPEFERDAVERCFERLPGAVIDLPPIGTSLGAALNRGLARTDARFVAKFDDDDLYGPHHLADSLRAHSYCGAGVVGKHSYYAHFPERSDTVLRFGGHEFSYSSTLAGGTLVIDRELVDDQQFEDISLGEDRAFLAACHRRGISTFSADRFNFTQIRSTHNTWQPGDEVFMAGTHRVDTDDAQHRIDR